MLRLLLTGAAAAVTGLYAVSCTTEMEDQAYGSSDPTVRFMVDAETRAGNTGALIESRAVTERDKDSVYVIATVTEGIEAPGYDAATRALPVTDNNLFSNFQVFAYTHDSNANPAGSPDMMNGITVSRVGTTNTFATDGTYLMPSSGSVSFFAIAPAEHWRVTVASTNNGRPTFTYNCPVWSQNHSDITFATTEATGPNGNIGMTFLHELACIRFMADSGLPSKTVTMININDMHCLGTFTPSFDTGTHGSWSLEDEGSSTLIPAQNTEPDSPSGYFAPVPIGGNSQVDITGSQYRFYILPQVCDATSNITIQYSDGSSTTIPLDGVEFKAGTTVIYTLTQAGVEFQVDAVGTQTGIEYTGGSISYNVLARQGSEPVDYVVEYSDDGSSWTQIWTSTTPGQSTNLPLTMFNATNRSAASGNYNFTHTMTIGETTVHINNSSQSDLSKRTPTGSADSPTSLADGTSSNCYMVNRAGYYEIPVVPGNAWVGGSANSNVLSKYPNYNGTNFVNSTIWMQANSAALLWQDVQGLVTNVSLHSSNGRNYIRFQVPQRNIAEGNAVLVARFNGTTVWSWHIWVTNLTDGNRGTVGTHQILQYPLGYVEGGNKEWVARNGQVRFRLASSDPNSLQDGEYFTFKIGQKAGPTVLSQGRYALYQWGRKDIVALVGMLPDNKVNIMTVWDGNNNKVAFDAASLSIGQCIQRPMTINTNAGNPGGDLRRGDLWNSLETSSVSTTSNTSTRKSLYDPSPKNFKVPPRPTYESIVPASSNIPGYSTTRPTGLNYQPATTENGTYLLHASSQVVFPLAGFLRIPSVALVGYGSAAGFWTSGKPTETRGNMFYIALQNASIGTFDAYGENTDVTGMADNTYFLNCAPVLSVYDATNGNQ